MRIGIDFNESALDKGQLAEKQKELVCWPATFGVRKKHLQAGSGCRRKSIRKRS